MCATQCTVQVYSLDLGKQEYACEILRAEVTPRLVHISLEFQMCEPIFFIIIKHYDECLVCSLKRPIDNPFSECLLFCCNKFYKLFVLRLSCCGVAIQVKHLANTQHTSVDAITLAFLSFFGYFMIELKLPTLFHVLNSTQFPCTTRANQRFKMLAQVHIWCCILRYEAIEPPHRT